MSIRHTMDIPTKTDIDPFGQSGLILHPKNKPLQIILP